MKVNDLAKDGKESGYGEELGTIKCKWRISYIEALRVEAIERGRSHEYYMRIALMRMLEELQSTRDDISLSDKERRSLRINIDRKEESLSAVEDTKEAIRIVKSAISNLDLCLNDELLKPHMKLHFDSIQDYINTFESLTIKYTLKSIFNKYIDEILRPSRTICKLLELNPNRDSGGHYFAGHKLNNEER